MNTHIVMDETGDTRHLFDAGDPKALARAERRLSSRDMDSELLHLEETAHMNA